MLDLFNLLLVALVFYGQRWDVIDIPDVAGLLKVLIAVNFSLLVGPVGERRSMSPHGDLGGHVNQLEVSRHSLELALALINLKLKESIVETISSRLLLGDSGELLIGGEVGRCNIMRKEDSVGDQMTKTDGVAKLNALANFASER